MAMEAAHGGHEIGLGANARTDRWWVGPLLTFLGFSAFIVYATWAAFQGTHFYAVSYLSPFYSPVIYYPPGASEAVQHHAWLGAWPAWWPGFLPTSPAFFILIFPGTFRFTCYYYRKAYYRSFAATPPGCGVGALPQKEYKGETYLMVFQNLHRYAMYFALIFIVILYYDAFCALFHDGKFGFGVGTLVLFINATLLACYTLGCHSLRHLVGGKMNCFSCGGCGVDVRHKAWKGVTKLNINHMQWAWISLFWVGFTDVYVRLVSMGIINDWNTWGL